MPKLLGAVNGVIGLVVQVQQAVFMAGSSM
jgi:hypothetical protein